MNLKAFFQRLSRASTSRPSTGGDGTSNDGTSNDGTDPTAGKSNQAMTEALYLTPALNATTTKTPQVTAKPTRMRRVLRWTRNLSLAGVVLAILTFTAIQTDPRVGPFLADTARAILGPAAVAKVEDWVYGLKDQVDSVRHKGEAPKTYWTDAPGEKPVLLGQAQPSDPGPSSDGGADATARRAFPPMPFAPPFPQAATKVDGQWFAISDDVDSSVVMAKSLVHPDAKRPYSAVAVVAIDLEHTALKLVAGTDEPASETVKRDKRPGKVPETDHAKLIATFNGGWQAVHGHFGMMVDGLTLLPPKDKSCTVALYKDGSLKIAPWSSVSDDAPLLQSFRQTPPCLLEGGSHNTLLADTSKNWGAAVDGATVIRRSAIGIDSTRKVLFYGVGDSLSALSIAEALRYAGAADVAELDVNWAFPRFLTYVHPAKIATGPGSVGGVVSGAAGGSTSPTVKATLIPATYKPGEYVSQSWYRDFFYLTKK